MNIDLGSLIIGIISAIIPTIAGYYFLKRENAKVRCEIKTHNFQIPSDLKKIIDELCSQRYRFRLSDVRDKNSEESNELFKSHCETLNKLCDYKFSGINSMSEVQIFNTGNDTAKNIDIKSDKIVSANSNGDDIFIDGKVLIDHVKPGDDLKVTIWGYSYRTTDIRVLQEKGTVKHSYLDLKDPRLGREFVFFNKIVLLVFFIAGLLLIYSSVLEISN